MKPKQPIQILQLAYIGVAATDMNAWRAFASDYLGMQVVDLAGQSVALRMDERHQRFLIRPGAKDGVSFLGLELQDEDALDRAAQVLATGGIVPVPGDAAECDIRGVRGMRWFKDPDGNRLELFHGARNAIQPFQPGRPIGGFRTGNLGFGHVVMQTPNYAAMKKLYTDVLGFRLSDYIDTPFEGSFLHVNRRHHSLAILSGAEARFHHVMVEYNFMDDVGRLYDKALKEDGRIVVSLGRHSNDHMLSFYSKSPAGFMVETGWAGRLLEEDSWKPEKLSAPSLWGHDRSWLPPAARQEIKNQLDELARQGVLAPTEVIDTPAFNLARITGKT